MPIRGSHWPKWVPRLLVPQLEPELWDQMSHSGKEKRGKEELAGSKTSVDHSELHWTVSLSLARCSANSRGILTRYL